MIHPVLTSMRRDLKYFEILLYRKYKERVNDCTDIIIFKTSAKLLEYKTMFESLLNPSKKEEIFYFKNIKTKLLAIVHLCVHIKKLEVKNIAIKNHKREKHYIKHLTKCHKDIFQLDFYYSYYIAKATHSDDKFFLRIEADILRTIKNEIIEIDCRSNTPYLFLFAKSEALYYFKKYILYKIQNLNTFSSNNTPLNLNSSNIQWTASKTDLIELIYALHAAGVFNNGKATIKDIVETFQELSNSDLSNHNRIFHDIKLRKKVKTKHIDHLKRGLLQKINNADYQLFDD